MPSPAAATGGYKKTKKWEPYEDEAEPLEGKGGSGPGAGAFDLERLLGPLRHGLGAVRRVKYVGSGPREASTAAGGAEPLCSQGRRDPEELVDGAQGLAGPG